MNNIQLERKEINRVRRWIQATFPNYKGYKVRLDFTDQPLDLTSYWDSGYRDYHAVMGSNGQVAHIPQNGTPYDHIATPHIAPTADIAVVTHHMMGDRESITIHFHPSLAPKFMPETVVNNTRAGQ